MRRPIRFALLAVALIAGFAARPAAAADVLVFAAASLKNALDDAIADYAKRTSVKVEASYAASGLLAKQIQGKLQAQQLLALIAQYQRDDVRAAFERAVRFGAFSLAAIRRILAATAKPKQWPGELANLHDMLPPSLREDPIGPRPASDYQQLLLPEEPSHEAPSEQEKSNDESDPDRPKPA